MSQQGCWVANGDKELGLQGELTEADLDLYGRITRGEEAQHGDSASLQKLFAWQMVTADPETPDEIVALEPKEAARRILMAEAEAMARRAARMAGIPDVADQLARHYERARGGNGRSCEFLSEPATVNARIKVALAGAEKEMLTAQPGGPRNQEVLEMAQERDANAIDRGVRIRTLYRDSVRDDPITRKYATFMTCKGAQFRTLVAPFERAIVIDRREAFISDHADPDSHPHAAWHVRDRAFVAWIVQVFDETWRRADIWNGDSRAAGTCCAAGTGARTTRVQREILRDTCSGVDQRKTASRLGVSTRRVTRELEQLRKLFGAVNTTQLVYLWARSPEHDIDDETGAQDAA